MLSANGKEKLPKEKTLRISGQREESATETEKNQPESQEETGEHGALEVKQ